MAYSSRHLNFYKLRESYAFFMTHDQNTSVISLSHVKILGIYIYAHATLHVLSLFSVSYMGRLAKTYFHNLILSVGYSPFPVPPIRGFVDMNLLPFFLET